MKIFCFSIFLSFLISGVINAQVLITEVADGTQALSYPRYVEITNEGSSTFNLQNYKLKIFMNGTATVYTVTFNSYNLPSGESLVVTNIDNLTADQRWSDYNLTAPPYCIYSETNVIRGNGNDCYQLLNTSNAVIDVYGEPTVNGTGQPWEYTDSYAYRNLNITSPNSTFTLSEWTIAPIDILDGMGSDLSPYLTPGYRALSSENDILSFSIPEQTGTATINTTTHRVDIEVTAAANLTNLTPTITVSPSASINPIGGEAHDFSISPFVYTVTAQDATPQNWEIYVTQTTGVSSENDILTFTITGQLFASVISTVSHTVDIVMTYGTDLSFLFPAISVSPGANINPLSGTPQNFTSPVIYTVTAEDGISIQNWTVNATTENSSENDIITFTLTQQTGPAVVNTTFHTVDIEVQNGTNLTALVPQVTVSNGATLSPVSGISQNFSTPFTYVVTAQDNTPQNWIVTVTEAAPLNNETDIVAFSFSEQTGSANISIVSHTVGIEVVNGTNITTLTPSIQISAGATIFPQSGVQIDFTTPVNFVVTAENGTNTQNWTVTVTVDTQLSSEAEITNFILAEQISPAVINSSAATVDIVVQAGTDISQLNPNITVSAGADISPLSGTIQDFTFPVTYTVTAQDLTTKQWIVSVSVYSDISIDASNNLISIFPNPASNYLIIESSNNILNAFIYSLSGNIAKEYISLSGETRLDVKNLKPGLYIICIEDSSRKKFNYKFIKK